MIVQASSGVSTSCSRSKAFLSPDFNVIRKCIRVAQSKIYTKSHYYLQCAIVSFYLISSYKRFHLILFSLGTKMWSGYDNCKYITQSYKTRVTYFNSDYHCHPLCLFLTS